MVILTGGSGKGRPVGLSPSHNKLSTRSPFFVVALAEGRLRVASITRRAVDVPADVLSLERLMEELDDHGC
jgi:hypothetical protein